MVKLKPKKTINGVTARLPEVQGVVLEAGKAIETLATMYLASHRNNKDSRHHEVGSGRNRNVKYGSIDYEIYITGPAPVSMELGHQAKDGSHVRGLYILGRAAGII